MPQLYSMDLSRLSTIMMLESLLITAWMSLVPGVHTCLETSMETLTAGILLGYCTLRIKLMANVNMSPITLNTSLTDIPADQTSTPRETLIHSTGQGTMLTFSCKGRLQLVYSYVNELRYTISTTRGPSRAFRPVVLSWSGWLQDPPRKMFNFSNVLNEKSLNTV